MSRTTPQITFTNRDLRSIGDGQVAWTGANVGWYSDQYGTLLAVVRTSTGLQCLPVSLTAVQAAIGAAFQDQVFSVAATDTGPGVAPHSRIIHVIVQNLRGDALVGGAFSVHCVPGNPTVGGCGASALAIGTALDPLPGAALAATANVQQTRGWYKAGVGGVADVTVVGDATGPVAITVIAGSAPPVTLAVTLP